jgi:hypothetical protein
MPLRAGPRALAGVLLVVVAALGVAGGVALERFVLAPAQPHARTDRYSAERAHHFAKYLAGELELSPAQQRTVDSILVARQAQARAVAAQVRPRFDSITTATRADLYRVFTPRQHARYDELRERHRREREGRQ